MKKRGIINAQLAGVGRFPSSSKPRPQFVDSEEMAEELEFIEDDAIDGTCLGSFSIRVTIFPVPAPRIKEPVRITAI